MAAAGSSGKDSKDAQPIGAASHLFSDDPLGTGVSPYLLQRKKHQTAEGMKWRAAGVGLCRVR